MGRHRHRDTVISRKMFILPRFAVLRPATVDRSFVVYCSLVGPYPRPSKMFYLSSLVVGKLCTKAQQWDITNKIVKSFASVLALLTFVCAFLLFFFVVLYNWLCIVLGTVKLRRSKLNNSMADAYAAALPTRR